MGQSSTTDSMPDNLNKATRSKVMASIRGTNTRPELKIRRLLWNRGMRYRIHRRDIPGTPDIAIMNKRVAIFIDGCFWHGCPTCYLPPSSHKRFWQQKLARNRQRRTEVVNELRREGWTVISFWEHQTNKDPTMVVNEIERCVRTSPRAKSGHRL